MSRTHDDGLLARHHHDPSAATRRELVERFMPLAHSVATRFSSPAAQDFDDVLQVASVGLLNAIDRFEPDRGLAFSSFAVPTISGEIKRYFRDRTWAVRPPRSLLELGARVERTAKELGADGAAPTVAQIAAHLGDVDEEQVLEAMQALTARTAHSMQAATRDGEEGSTLGDRLGREDRGIRDAEDRALLVPILRLVGEREREMLRMRFEDDMTQAEIGERFGVSQMQVSRLIRSALQRMHQAVGELEPAGDRS